MIARYFGILVVLGGTAGCARPLVPDLGGIYDRAAGDYNSIRNPIIVIPGILGSRLMDEATGRVVWGAFGGGSADPEEQDGARLVALPMGKGATLAELQDGVHANSVLDTLEVQVLGLPLLLNAYRNILGSLGVGGYLDEELGRAAVDYGSDHYTCFQFPYDWRRDLAENAAQLHEFLLAKEAFVRRKRAERGDPHAGDVEFDLVAHSMGGLLARYYLRYGNAPLDPDGEPPEITWRGAEMIDRAVLIGTPNAGSLNALTQLTGGLEFSAFTPRYEPAILGTFPAAYQLLPRARHGLVVGAESAAHEDVFDPELWKRMGWGLADPEQDGVLRWLLPDVEEADERRAIALDHQAKCLRRARQVTEALDREATAPDGLGLYLIAGDAVDTPSKARIDPESGTVSVIEHSAGDGTVLRSSALMDERLGGNWMSRLRSPIQWRQVHFLFRGHLGLTQDPAFVDNVLYILLEDPR